MITDDTELVAREREQAGLDHALASVRAGSGGIMLLAGEAGVGETRLPAPGATLACRGIGAGSPYRAGGDGDSR
jgi:hypothetical protein